MGCPICSCVGFDEPTPPDGRRTADLRPLGRLVISSDESDKPFIYDIYTCPRCHFTTIRGSMRDTRPWVEVWGEMDYVYGRAA